MIIGIGVDIIEISRFESKLDDLKFLERIFTEHEVDFSEKTKRKAEIYAGTFSSKEAVSKALGTGVRGFSFKDIEIIRDELGKPQVVLHRKAKALAEELGVKKIFLSISHTDNNCTAFCVLEG